MILETIVTTVDPAGAVNIAPKRLPFATSRP